MATTRAHKARAPLIEHAIVVVALAAFASSFLPMLDSEALRNCGCTETFRLSDFHGGIPALVLALFALARIVTGHRGGVVRRGLQVLTVVCIVLVLVVFFPQSEGPGAVAGGLAHSLLVSLLVIRWVTSWESSCNS